MKFTKAILILMTIILSSSCGNSIKEKTLKVSDVSITGDAGDYLEVVSGSYTLKVVEEKIVLTIEFKLIEEYDLEGTPEVGDISLVPLDQSGAAIADIGLEFGPASISDYDKINNLLKGKVGDKVKISFEWDYFSDEDVQNRIMEQTVNFEITGADFTNSDEDESYSEDDDFSEDDESSLGSEDWDEILNEYEDYINKYIKLLKKAKNGDSSAMEEYTEMMESASELAEKIENGGDDLTSAQLARFSKLQLKLSNAAAEMY